MEAITVPASLTSLEQVACYVRTLAQRGNLSASAEYKLRLAIDEIVTNIIVHGYREGPGEICVSGGLERDHVWLQVADRAPRFDPRTIHSGPQPDTPVMEMRLGGLGLFLALQAVDGFSYEFVNGKNINTLTMSSASYGGCR
jgi:anti-sigma regulatory factor (Ser/Thr protein kinase)